MTDRLQRGGSLLELLVALLVGTIVTGGAFLCVNQFQRTADHLTALLDRDQSLVIAPLLLERWVAVAGCALQDSDRGLTISGTVLQVGADIDGPDGFPDGLLESPFESIEIRSSRDALQLRSGDGSFQPVLNFVRSLDFAHETETLLRIRLKAASSLRLGSIDPPAVERRFAVHLWNRRAELFKE